MNFCAEKRRAVFFAAALISAGGCADQLTSPDEPLRTDLAAHPAEDIQAPEVFSVTELGLWDGRPSLGGIWVSHPAAQQDQPERVLIRNQKTGDAIIGALFQRDVTPVGPDLLISSDAAKALAIPAGTAVMLEVIALRQKGQAPGPRATRTGPLSALSDAPQTRPDVTPLAQTGSRIARAIVGPDAVRVSDADLAKPFIQVGIFSVKSNADNSAVALRREGIVPTIRKQTSQGEIFYRVVIGPATSPADRTRLLKKVRDLGFKDAFLVAS